MLEVVAPESVGRAKSIGSTCKLAIRQNKHLLSLLEALLPKQNGA